ncbi:hypothetical protein K2173_010727 [Erythroxylum novogranatense]|uniref:Uncharacterized protein n=1 Tax=Erythroxylum novogranatense TaxID=1862640 RepID=A0AAV8SRI9_9ROSI|nr:hypothetical protein K2173_010727 [Erythroxylum novogranatense]
MGGGSMRVIGAKTAGIGIGIVSPGLRGAFSSSTSSAEHSVRNASRLVSPTIVSHGVVKQSGVADVQVQKPSWELDEWEFAGGQEEEEELHRVVFGGAPSLDEAKAATTELKDALEKVCVSSTSHKEIGPSSGGQLSGQNLLRSSDDLETKGFVICEPKEAPVPKFAMRAFALLNESPAVQTVVASIASDPNVWDAVSKNDELVDFLESQKRSVVFEDSSPINGIETSDDKTEAATGNSQNGMDDVFEKIKHAVAEMVSNISSFFQNIFGFSSAENGSGANCRMNPMERTLGTSLMALAVMVIMVAVLKRA